MIVTAHDSALVYEEGPLAGFAILTWRRDGFELIARRRDFKVVSVLLEYLHHHQLLLGQLIERAVAAFAYGW